VKVIAVGLLALFLVGCARAVGTGGGAQAVEESLEVTGSSMEPTLHCARPAPGCLGRRDDRVVVQDEAQIERREVVAFAVGAKARARCGAGGLFVKRVIGVAGDRIEFRDGAVFRNGLKLREPYVDGPTDAGAASRVEVPLKHVFVLGDNRAQSCDSRVWGPLAVRRVVGVGVAIERGERRLSLP
jgi:signal peptidase I